MSIKCPICETSYSEITPNFCTTCGWNLSENNSINQGLDHEENGRLIEWAKRVWLNHKNLVITTKQAEIAIKDRENQIDDLQESVDLLKRRLERLTVEKHQSLEIAKQQENSRVSQLANEINQLQTNLQNQQNYQQYQLELLNQRLQEVTHKKEQQQAISEKLEIEILQLKQLLENAELANQQHQQCENNLQNQLSDKQEQIDLLQRRLQQVNIENQEIPKLKTQVDKLQIRLQTIDTNNEQLKTDLQQQQIQNYTLQTQLQERETQVKQLIQQEKIAQVALSQWLQSALFEEFITEIKNVTDPINAVELIKQIQQKRLNQEWQNLPVHSQILRFVTDLLTKKEVSKDELQTMLEKYHAIIVVDAILTVRAELKYNLIIGDYLHGF